MFYCERCKNKYGWPSSIRRSLGRCEVCKKLTDCNEAPSSVVLNREEKENMTKTVYISIGNSDDKLSQREWSEFVRATREVLEHFADAIHGSWLSMPSDPWQNACWCVEFRTESAVNVVRMELGQLADQFRQDTIAWAEAATDFIIGAKSQRRDLAVSDGDLLLGVML